MKTRAMNIFDASKVNTAYASSEQTLEDYFKSNICTGRDIYCAFIPTNINVLYYRMWLNDRMKSLGIRQIDFKGKVIIKQLESLDELVSNTDFIAGIKQA